ncbi:DUF459 domain-containing protein [Myxococcus stipitatus]|uniref:DUF459 domain-containing protein n=1 Tax=Myxococcus stipitatus TaxID=83455 RepID=UPI001F363B7C|nr:DUF459 domain-containing protein [Myxococcus stipitatus]MCE9667667.1 DUF459 domain-containing protein [Myxococcus stipitatus]
MYLTVASRYRARRMQNRFTCWLVVLAVLSSASVQAQAPGASSGPAPTKPVASSPAAPAKPVVSPPAPAPSATAAVAPAPSERPRSVLLLGDSLIATGFGDYLLARLEAHPDIRASRRARSSTGLARPDFFDWMAVGEEEVKRHQPDVVVVILGGNDGQSLLERDGSKPVHWGKPEWGEAYRRRIDSFASVISAPGRKIVWLELPATGLKRFEQKLGVIRELQREVIGARADARYVDTRAFFTDAQGRALSQARVEGFRKPMKLRMSDGVHFTVAGGRYFASKVYPEVLGALGLAQG